jgi:5'-3' exonuclease
VSATIGLVETTLSLLREPEVTHLGVATDHVIRSFRNRMYAGYKTEVGMPEELLAQFQLAEDALRATGLVVWPMVEFEADDAMATAAARWAGTDDVEQVVICSPDKDLGQCVRDGLVVQRDRRKDVTFDEGGVHERLGVSPVSVPDYLALVGDAADGYPGLPGWGAKSAAAVLARYGRLEHIPAHPAEWDVPVRSAPRLATTLAEQRDRAMLFRRLATLRDDVPIGADVDALRWTGPRAEFTAWSERLGTLSLRERAARRAAAHPS